MSLAKYDPVTIRTCHRLSWGTHYSSFAFGIHSISTIDHLSFFIATCLVYISIMITFFFIVVVMYVSCIYNYQCNQCLSPLRLWVRISIRARCTTFYDKVCQWPATCRWFSPCTPVSSTNKTYPHDITEILLKVALSTIKQANKLKLWYILLLFSPWIQLLVLTPLSTIFQLYRDGQFNC
jgi:hypothetical protein